MKPKHIVIYSHGFGVQKDDDGLFTDISNALKEDGIQSVLFDYFEYHPDTKELLTTPFSAQVEKLAEVIKMTRKENPDARISIIAHSQGCIIPTLCNLEGVERIIAISPFSILT